MSKCPTCGAENDPGNRFCDQCGTALEPSSAAPQVAAGAAQSAATCPNCGAMVVPGQAFCDECGAVLTMNTPVAVAAVGAPTVLAGNVTTMTDQAPVSTAPDSTSVGVVCPVCGHQNMPGDRFCDNCGAALVPSEPTALAADAQTVIAMPSGAVPVTAEPDDAFAAPDAPPQDAPPIGEPPAVPPPLEEPPTPAPTPEREPEPPAPPIGEPPTDTPPITLDAPAADALAPVADALPLAADALPSIAQTLAPAADVQASYAAEQQRLNDEIARQGQIIAQFEQMQQMFGAATPPTVTQGLDDARAALTQAQADLAALTPPAPAVDPAEVARLNDEIARQGQIIAQFEQMQQMFGAATPPTVTQGLDDARAALTQAQADLAALGVAPTAPAASAPPISAPAAPPAASAPPVSAPPAASAPPPAADDAFSAPTVFAPPPPTSTTPTAPAPTTPQGARLVFDDGREIALPAGKSEIIIGREDPISGIYPEVDLTAHGGETGGVSRQHAKLNQNGGSWTLTDLNSTNYTRLDGARLEPNTPVAVKDGSKVQFGRVAMTLRV